MESKTGVLLSRLYSIVFCDLCLQGDPYIIKDEKPKKTKKKKSDHFKPAESTIQFVDSLDEIDDDEMMVPPKKKKTIRSYNKEQDAEVNSSSNVIPDKQVCINSKLEYNVYWRPPSFVVCKVSTLYLYCISPLSVLATFFRLEY